MTCVDLHDLCSFWSHVIFFEIICHTSHVLYRVFVFAWHKHHASYCKFITTADYELICAIASAGVIVLISTPFIAVSIFPTLSAVTIRSIYGDVRPAASSAP